MTESHHSHAQNEVWTKIHDTTHTVSRRCVKHSHMVRVVGEAALPFSILTPTIRVVGEAHPT